MVYALLLKPLPFPNPDQLIYAHDTFPAVPLASVSWLKFVALRDGNQTLTALAATASGTLTISGRGDPQRVVTPRVSGDFFKVLGVAPLAGRGITPTDDVPNAAPVVVLSYGLWQRAFGGDMRIVGEAVTTDGVQRTIIGIMPPDFVYPAGAQAWVPLATWSPLATISTDPANAFLRLLGRMKPGVTLRQATDDLAAVTAAFNEKYRMNRAVRIYPLHEDLSQTNRQMLVVLQGAVLLVLLIACANVANMLLARSMSRRRELAVRLAIGAGPMRLLRQLLTESVMLAAMGGVLGVLLGGWLLRLFVSLAPSGFAGIQTIAIDRHVLLFTTAVAMLTGIVFGIAPARRGFRVDAAHGLRDATARGSSSSSVRGASRLLVVAEIAFAMMLVAGAGLLVKSLLRLQAQDAGVHADGLLTFQITLPSGRYDDDKLRRAVARILDDVRAIPGVNGAGGINFLPLTSFGFSGPFTIQGRPVGRPDRLPVIEYRIVTPGYFAAMGIPIVQGTEFREGQTRIERPIAIINESDGETVLAEREPGRRGDHARHGREASRARDRRRRRRRPLGLTADAAGRRGVRAA